MEMKRVHVAAARRLCSSPVLMVVAVGLAGCASNFKSEKLADGEISGIPVVAYQPAWVQREFTIKPKEGHPDAECTSPKTETSLETLPIGGTYGVKFEPSWFGKGEFTIDLNENGTLKTLTLNSDPQFAENLGAATEFLKTIVPVPPAAAGFVAPEEEPNCVVVGSDIINFKPYDGKIPDWDK